MRPYAHFPRTEFLALFSHEKVQKIDIAYSKTAKKIDVKKVKRAMWDIISSTSSEADKVWTYRRLNFGVMFHTLLVEAG